MPASHATRRLLVRLLVCAAALGVPSAAFADCAHDIIDQAYKGKVTGTFSQACYNAAIKIEPVDGSSYSDLDSIIKDAKHVAALKAQDSKVVSTPTSTNETARTQLNQQSTTTAPAATTTATTQTTAVGGGRVPPATTSTTSTTPVKPASTARTTPVAPAATLLGAPSATPVLDRLAPAHADDVPVPVIVLGVLAVLLVLAGVAGAIVRRRAGRSST
jgi:cobalamin biosynthesis Mg chelatase CobN